MKTRCPGCGAEMSVDVLLAGEDAGGTLAAVMGMTPLGRLLLRYLALFRPAGRALAWDRARRLVEEIAPAIVTGRVEHKGRLYAAPEAAWAAAIEQMLASRDSLRLPLKSHGYLISIVAAGAERAEAAAETRREDTRRVESQARGAAPDATPAPQKREIPQHIRGALAHYLPPKPQETPDASDQG